MRVDGASGRPGEAVAARAGDRLVVVEADIGRPAGRLAARLSATVPVMAGRTTRLRIALPGLLPPDDLTPRPSAVSPPG